MAQNTVPAPIKLTTTHWLICFVASMGFAFDIYAILVMPLILGPSLAELGHLKPGTPEYNNWAGLFFFAPALFGGFFGLIGGYMTDLWGRQKVLVVSILLYALSAVAAGFSTSIEELLFWRCTTFVGVCVEFVAAVAWLAELFPNPKQRESVLGYTQAFSSIGGLLAAGTNFLAVAWAASLPAINGQHASWRYTLIAGVLPAIPLMIIRPFLPESPEWARKKKDGTLKRPSIAELFQPAYRRTTIVTAIMFACSYGAAFGAIQHLPRIVPGLPELAGMARPAQLQVANQVQSYQEIGGLIGRVVLAFLAIRILSRRKLLRVFQVPGLLLVPLVFFYPAKDNLELLKIGAFAAGLLTVAQFSFWGNYLPRVYPLHLRGTGESFAANVGGRMIGTSAAYLTTTLANYTTGTSPSMKLANAATMVALLAYAIGFIASFYLPEPNRDRMAE
ncbi:MAG: MFS transporter [Candidatus Solibacter usitatus]|nr:MFS transporter [Candidatus Solibacter usitatus]